MSRARPRLLSRLAVLAVAACATLAVFPALAAADTTFTVNTTADNGPSMSACEGAPGDCSLRQALARANVVPGADTIVLPAGHYALTIKGSEEDEAETGDLDVEEETEVTIQGAGARSTIVDAAGLEDRVFDVRSLGSLSLSRLSVTGGLAIGEGGGGIRVENEGGLALDRVAVRGNTSSLNGSGGGLSLESAEVTISASLIAGNRNSGDGGGLYSGNTDLSIVNTSIVNNAVDTSLYPENPGWGAYGGGMEVSEGHLAMQNVTIAGNSVADKNGGDEGSGAAIEGGPETAEIVNTIVYGNTWLNVNPADQSQCSETLESEGHNIEEQPLPEQPRCFEEPTDMITNPLLGPLADNGGETDTMALLAGSPAFNAGLQSRCPSFDQRGLPRPQLGSCDVGAFEVQPPQAPVPPRAAAVTPTRAPKPASPAIKRSGKVKLTAAGATFWVWPGLKLTCPAGSQPCAGTIKARAPKPQANGKAGSSAKKKVLVGKAKFSVAPGKGQALKLKLNSRGAKLLSELGKLRTQFEVVSRIGAGPPVKAKKTAKLKLPKGA